MLQAFYDPACDFLSGITGGLRCKIVRRTMYDDGTPNDILRLKPIGIYRIPGGAIVSKQRRQIACVLGMLAVVRIIVAFCIRKRILCVSGTAVSLVHMHSEYCLLTLLICKR